jgi:hypothetical protein
MYFNIFEGSVSLQNIAMAVNYSHDCQLCLVDGMNHLPDVIEAIISLNI